MSSVAPIFLPDEFKAASYFVDRHMESQIFRPSDHVFSGFQPTQPNVREHLQRVSPTAD